MALNYSKLLKKGLISLAGGLAEEIALAGLKEVAKCLLKLTGFKTKKDKEEEFREWAISVTESLQTINIKVDQLNDQMTSGLKQIVRGQMFSNYQTQYNDTVNSRGLIADAYEELKRIISTSEKASADRIASDINKLRNRQQEILRAAHQVADFWGHDPFGSSRNLLENFTDSCILSAGDSVEGLELYYNQLEENFQLGIYTLFKAYSVLVTLKNYETQLDDKGELKQPVKVDEKDAETAGWLEDQVKNFFEPVTKAFVSCVNRLVLSTYHPDIGDNRPSFGDADVVRKTMAKAQLQSFLIVNMDLSVVSPGLLVTQFLRPSMLKDKGSKIDIKIAAADGSAKLEENAGTRWKPEAKYTSGPCMTNWYKAVDRDANGDLMGFADSDIVVMNYSRPYNDKESAATFTVTSGYVTPGAIPWVLTKDCKCENYSISSLENKTTQTDETVAMAFVMLTGHITDPDRGAFPLSSPDRRPGQYVYDYKESKEFLEEHAIDGTVYIYGPTGPAKPVTAVEVNCVFRDAFFSKDHDFTFITTYPVKYAANNASGGANPSIPGAGNTGEEKKKLILAHSTSVNVRVGDYKSSGNEMRKAQVEIAIYKTGSNGDSSLDYFNHKYGSNSEISNHALEFTDTSINKPYATNDKYIAPGQLTVPMKPGEKTVINWMVKIWVQGMDPGVHMANDDVKGGIYIFAQLAWPQPKPE